MRHGKKFNHLSRTSAHRKAMLANMASSLIIHKRIKTTTAKAKALRVYIEPLITKSKSDTTHSRRTVFSYLNDKEAVTELFREISVKIRNTAKMKNSPVQNQIYKILRYVDRTSINRKTDTSRLEKPAGRISKYDLPTNNAKHAKTAESAGFAPRSRPV